MARPKITEKKQLTETELQFMNILWGLTGATVHEVQTGLKAKFQKDCAYTTVSTILRVLEKKAVVTSAKEGRGHRYFPAVARETYQQEAVSQILEHVFLGEPLALVKSLLGNQKVSAQEMLEIAAIIKRNRK